MGCVVFWALSPSIALQANRWAGLYARHAGNSPYSLAALGSIACPCQRVGNDMVGLVALAALLADFFIGTDDTRSSRA